MAGIILPQLHRAMGSRQARRYALTGERFDAHEARRVGLVHEVCAPAALDATGSAIVDALLASAPRAVAATKHRLLQVTGADLGAGALRDLVDEHAALRRGEEAAEGLAAFRAKRAPHWVPGSP
jgi:methylglutaconyl-CoA hydratase